MIDQEKRDQKLKNGTPISSILTAIQDVLNYECNCNLKIVGCFGSSHPLPHPCNVLNDVSNSMNPQTVLSPFTVIRKMMAHIQLSKVTNLVFDGFPKTDTVQEREECFAFFNELQKLYRRRLVAYDKAFAEALKARGGPKAVAIPPCTLPAMLCGGSNESLDQVYLILISFICMYDLWLLGTLFHEYGIQRKTMARWRFNSIG